MLLAAVVCSCWAAPAGDAEEPTWRAGAASAAITPPQWMWMAGYGSRNRPADSKLTDLYAKALALEAADQRPAVLVTLDLVGVGADFTAAVREDAARECGVDPQRIIVCCSHTHSGPVVGRNLAPLHYRLLDPRQQALVDEYESLLRQRVLEVVRRALQGMAPAKLHYGSGTATFGVNRRNNKEAQVPELRESGRLAGPVDHQAPVLLVREASSAARPLAVVFGYACHATVLSDYAWSGDYPGYAQAELEQALPGCVALFWAGCGGDINPLPRRRVELAENYGRQLAAVVLGVLQGELAPLAPRLRCSLDTVDLPLADPGPRSTWEERARSENRFEQARAALVLEQWDAGQPPRRDYPYPLALWRLGDDGQPLYWYFLGGEVVVDYSLKIKSQSPPATWVAAYANDVMAYIPSRRVLAEGGYEGGGSMVYYGLPAHWAPEVESLLLQEAARQRDAASRDDE